MVAEGCERLYRGGRTLACRQNTIAAWAVRTKRYTAPPRSIIKQCAQELADAMRLEMERDPQGRTVRAKHCATIRKADSDGNYTQQTLWFDRHSWTPELMQTSLQQRRNIALGELSQLKTDQDSFNDNNEYGAEIQLSFNFEPDLVEQEHDTEYNPPPMPDDLDDEIQDEV